MWSYSLQCVVRHLGALPHCTAFTSPSSHWTEASLLPDSILLASLCLGLSTCQIAHRMSSALKVLQVTVHLDSCILCVGSLVCCAGSFSATFKSCGSLGASHTGNLSLRGFFKITLVVFCWAVSGVGEKALWFPLPDADEIREVWQSHSNPAGFGAFVGAQLCPAAGLESENQEICTVSRYK